MKQGCLYGISVGPGDPELITVKGLRRLQHSPIVAFPAGIGKRGIAETIVQDWLQPQQTRLALDFPYVQNQQVLTQAWQQAAKKVYEYLQQGLDVAFACEGDVSFYSTFTYLAQTLHQLHPEVKIETVAGVCSPVASASALGIPLTIQHQRLIVLPALYQVEELEKALDMTEVVVLLKVASVYQSVWQILAQRQLLDKAMVVEWATQPQQKIYRQLQNYPQLNLSYFSLLIVSCRGVARNTPTD